MDELEKIESVLIEIYGDGSMVTALAKDIAAKMPEYLEDDGGRGASETERIEYQLHMHVWNWFAGGGTAEIAARRLMEALGLREP